MIIDWLIILGIQALMGAASQSSEESPTSCDGTQKIQVLALARAIANSSPIMYDKEALNFNVRNQNKQLIKTNDKIIINKF